MVLFSMYYVRELEYTMHEPIVPHYDANTFPSRRNPPFSPAVRIHFFLPAPSTPSPSSSTIAESLYMAAPTMGYSLATLDMSVEANI